MVSGRVFHRAGSFLVHATPRRFLPPKLAIVSLWRHGTDQPAQLPLPPPTAPKSRQRITPAPEQAAKAYIARRAKPSVVSGHVRLTFTLDMPRELAERLSARAIHRGVSLEPVVNG